MVKVSGGWSAATIVDPKMRLRTCLPSIFQRSRNNAEETGSGEGRMSTRRKHGRTGGRKWSKEAVRSHNGTRIPASPAVFPTEISVLAFRFDVTRKHRRW